MYPILFGGLEAYQFFVTVGSILGIAAFLCVLYREVKDWKITLLNLLVNLVIILIGAKASEILKALNTQEFSSVAELLLERKGSHFLGRVLFAAWMYPLVYRGLHRLFGKRINWCDQKALDAVSFYFVIQHFFNRIACFCNGCCSGKRYYGFGAIAYQDVGYVYPSQLIEALFMVVLFVLLWVRKRRKKPLFGFVLTGFGIAILMSEFWMDQAGILLILGLNVIQYAGILCILTGVIYMRSNRKRDRKKDGRL